MHHRDLELFRSAEQVERRYLARYLPGQALYRQQAAPVPPVAHILVNLPSLKGGASSRLGRVSRLAKGSSCPQNVDRTDSVGMPGEGALLAGEDCL